MIYKSNGHAQVVLSLQTRQRQKEASKWDSDMLYTFS